MIKELNYTQDYGERIAKKRDEIDFPQEVIFEITHRCNLRCRHCYLAPAEQAQTCPVRDNQPKADASPTARISNGVNTDLRRISTPRQARGHLSMSEEQRQMTDNQCIKKELSTKEVFSIFDQLVEAGCLHLVLTGGEPLMRKDILSLIDYARRIGLFIHLFTNATLITPRIVDKLKELQLISLEISFHSLKKERFDWFTQVAGSYERVMTAIKLLKKRRIKLTLKINITKANFDEIAALSAFAKYLDARPQWASFLVPRYNGSKDNIALRLEPEEVMRASDILSPELTDDKDLALGEVQNDDNERGERWVRGRLFQCGVGKKGLAISPYGELKPCLELPSLGYSLLNGTLRQGWSMLRDYVRTFKPSPQNKCFDCALRSFCSSCPAKAMWECGDMNGCPDYYRRLAQLRTEGLKNKAGIRTDNNPR